MQRADSSASDRSSPSHDMWFVPSRTRADNVQRFVELLLDVYLTLVPDERAVYENLQKGLAVA